MDRLPDAQERPDDDIEHAHEHAHRMFQIAVGESPEEPSSRTLLTLTPVDDEPERVQDRKAVPA